MPTIPRCPAIWMYWDNRPGETRSGYLHLCEATVRHHAGSIPIHIVNRETLPDWIGTVRPEFDRLSLVHRADYARTRLVLAHGGLWLDMDTIALRDLSELYGLLSSSQFLCYGEVEIQCGTFAGPADSPILRAWALSQDAVIDAAADPSLLSWNSLGSDLIDWSELSANSTRVPEWMIAPIDWRDWREFLSRTLPSSTVLRDDPYVVALYNAALHPHLGGMSAEDVLKSRRLFARLLRVGLGHVERDEADDLLVRFAALGRLHLRLEQRKVVRSRIQPIFPRKLLGRARPRS